jgi:phosphoglycerol geranylgeranyltransferase
VLTYLVDRLRLGPLHFTLIDPEKSDPASAARLAAAAAAGGSDAILLGGSTGISRATMDEMAGAIKSQVQAPVIVFPEGPTSLTPRADAVLFMSLLNSRNLELVVRAHAKTALAVREMGLEPIPLGYIVVAPGMRVGEVGEADVIPRDDVAGAQGYALAAEFLGMRLVYLEAGSGAPNPVPADMVRAVRSVLSVPLIVGGGIRTAEEARRLLEAGAQVLVTGSVAEEEGVRGGFSGILEEVRKARGG